MATRMKRNIIEGRPVLIVVDIQKGEAGDKPPAIPSMPGSEERMALAPGIVEKARECEVPIVFFQEAHRRDHIDFGRELDGVEDVHLLEGDTGTEVADELKMRSDDYFITKRRYSCFFGTDLEILLKGLRAETLVLIGGLTDVCVHYTFVDAHQHDYFCRVVEDCVTGSSIPAHEASLNAMEYLQTGARRTTAEIKDAFQAYRSGVKAA